MNDRRLKGFGEHVLPGKRGQRKVRKKDTSMVTSKGSGLGVERPTRKAQKKKGYNQ